MELNKDTTLNKNAQATTATSRNPEAEISKIVDEILAALNERDVDKLMSFYAPDIVAYDCTGPAQYTDIKEYRKSWEEAFAMSNDDEEGSSDFHGLRISADNTLGFVYAIRHDVLSPKDGKKMEMWMRMTQCFEKRNNKWLITHEQFSFPVDFGSGKALFNQRPEGFPTLH